MALSDEDREALAWQLVDVDEWIAHAKAVFPDADQKIAEKVAVCRARRAAGRDKSPRSERPEPDGSLTHEQIRTRQELLLSQLMSMHEAAKSGKLELARAEIEKHMDELNLALSHSGDDTK